MGNTRHSLPVAFEPTVHPHACGEHLCSIAPSAGTPGSSPRLWGTPLFYRSVYRPRRFIPTPVGNTVYVTAKTIAIAVHPHACGEHSNCALPKHSNGGSSPRLWGTQAPFIHPAFIRRFIPTPVGNTGEEQLAYMDAAVHPHACGEHDPAAVVSRFIYGSSPRLWGTLPHPLVISWIWRFIPTPVGNTLQFNQCQVEVPVHPHACGEHHLRQRIRFFSGGSSPRLWGTRCCITVRC